MDTGPLPHLDTFAKAAELSGFTAAARALGLTQAAVSQRIQALEAVVGVPLFHRQGGRVLLTEAGRRLYSYAERILALEVAARAEVTGRTEPAAACELSLAASSVPGEHLLPDLLSEFHSRHPNVRVRATVADSGAALCQVEQGRAHLGLVGGRADSTHLEYRCFAHDRLALVVPPAHPWARRRQAALREVCLEPLILREPGSGSRRCLEQALAGAGRSVGQLQVGLELGSNEAITEAVQRGLGVAVLSERAVRKEVLAGRLRSLGVLGLCLDREILVAWDRRRVLPAPARLFLDLLGPGPGRRCLGEG